MEYTLTFHSGMIPSIKTTLENCPELYALVRERDALKKCVEGRIGAEEYLVSVDAATRARMGALENARALKAAQDQVAVLQEALRGIRDDYDCELQTRDHDPMYGGVCRVCAADRALKSTE